MPKYCLRQKKTYKNPELLLKSGGLKKKRTGKIIFETLKKNRDFESFRKKNTQVNSDYFKVIIVRVNDADDRLRLGYVVSKKVGKAVERNRIKRRIKEIFRNIKKTNKDSFNILFIAKKPIMNLGFNSLKDQILKSLQPYLQMQLFK